MTHQSIRTAAVALAVMTQAPALAPALAQDTTTFIHTGDASGAYHQSFCPRLEAELKQAKFAYTCKTSQGTSENLKRVLADPRQIGFGQLDILALDGMLPSAAPGAPSGTVSGTTAPVTLLRRDDVRECLFAVTRNKDVAAYGDLAANAAKLRFILPPVDSGSAGTFRYLKTIDSDGLGRAAAITHAATTDDAIRQALSADDTVTLFVQFPDPDNARFKLVSELGGHFVPVIDRIILRPQIGGEKIYFAQETQVANATWMTAGAKVVTACTPLAVFTGAAERVSGDKAAQDHKDLIATVRAIKSEAMLPTESTFARWLRRSKEISGAGTEQLLKLSEEAREKAKPMLDRAKDVGGKAMEAAKPALEKATEMGKQAIGKAEEMMKPRPPAEEKK